MKLRRHRSDAELIALLQAEAQRLGRTPGSKEVGIPGSLCPDQRVFTKRFGTWRAACEAAGLPARKPGQLARPELRARPRTRLHRFATSEQARSITEAKRRHWQQQGVA